MAVTVPPTYRSPARNETTPRLRSGAQIVWESLLAHGVDLVFGYPGGAALTLYDQLVRYPLRHVLVRHEQHAAHAADGYARATGKPGVCIATSGPGATNLVTGLATAWMDSVPLVALTGQVATRSIGTLAFQEVDIVSVSRPVVKAAHQVTHAADLASTLALAFDEARSGRPGPVLVDLPKDVQAEEVSLDGPLPVAEPAEPSATGDLISSARRVASMLARAERPVLIAGRGVLLAHGAAALRSLAERLRLPVAHTLLGASALPDDHPLSLGMLGMHGTVAANLAVHHADLVIGVGMRFDDRVVGRVEDFAPSASVVHVDVDPLAFGRCARADVPVLGDARLFLELLSALAPQTDPGAWWARLGCWRAAHADCGLEAGDQAPSSPAVMRALRAASERQGRRVSVVADVGQHQMFAARHYGLSRPNTFFTSGGLGTMGYALPAAMGVQLARPEETVWAIVGDGGFQMSLTELATLVAEGIPLKVAIVNNGFLGMVRQWQERYYARNYAHSALPQPDFARVAESFGCLGLRVTTAARVDEAIQAALAHPGPAVVDFRVPPEETVYPMVSPGYSLGEVACVEGKADDGGWL